MEQLSFSEACKVAATENFSCEYDIVFPIVVAFIAQCFNKTVKQVFTEIDYWLNLKVF